MPGNTVLQSDGASGTPSSSSAQASASTASTAPHRGTPGSGGGTSSAQQLQPRFKVWQPSFGPGSPQTPIVDIARALGGRKNGATKASAQGRRESGGHRHRGGGESGGGSGDFSANSSAALRAGAQGGTGIPSARQHAKAGGGGPAEGPRDRTGRVSLGAFEKTKSAADVVRGSKPWAGGVPGGRGGRGGEWEGGDSDDSDDDDDDDETSDEDDGDDLILRR